jgi:hypothetical protein
MAPTITSALDAMLHRVYTQEDMIETHRVCKTCCLTLPASFFEQEPNTTAARGGMCRACRAAEQRGLAT